jgi:hypothetical protein
MNTSSEDYSFHEQLRGGARAQSLNVGRLPSEARPEVARGMMVNFPAVKNPRPRPGEENGASF